MYQLIRKLYFNFDPERAHYMAMRNLQLFTKNMAGNQLIRALTKPPLKETHFLNLKFKNPVGLGAGFDKNAVFLNELEALGFGFVEIGTVTPLAQEGYEKPRLFRLPADKALINRMGFNNDGADQITRRLEAWREKTAGRKEDPYPLIIERADEQSYTEWIGGTVWSRPIDLTGQFTAPTRLEVVAQYLGLGYTHILPKGLDHILFVIGLFLLSAHVCPCWIAFGPESGLQMI